MKSIGLLFKVLWSPGEVMFSLSKNPRVLVPMVFLCLSSFVTGIVLVTKVPAAELALRAIERSPQGANLSDEQKERIRQRVNSPAIQSFTIATTALGPLVIVLTVTVIYFAVFTMIGREGGFKAFFSISAFAFVPTAFRQLTVVLNAFFIPPSSIMPDELGSLSPAVFLDRDSVSPVVFAGVNMIDIVSIWTLSLLVIGFGYVTRKSLSKATRAGTVFGVFLVYVVFRLVIASVRRF
jgi:Yip1 domain